MNNKIDQLGEDAKRLREELQGASDAVSGAREEVKGYRAEQKEKTAKLREILTPIVKHLQDGGTANGITGLHNWAWWYNPTTKSPKNSARQIMRIVNGLKKAEGDTKSAKAKSDFLARIADAKKKVGNIQRAWDAPFKPGETKDSRDLDQIDAIVEPVFQEFLALISPDGYEVTQGDRGWWAQEKFDEPTPKPKKQAKKKEAKKPLKHAKHPMGFGIAWCSTSLGNNNKAHQTRHATCPYCIAAMAADLRVVNPEMKRRSIEKDLKEAREALNRHEMLVQRCLPEYRSAHYQDSVRAIPEYREEVAKLEQELSVIKEIKTPEQAVEAAKKAAAEQEAEKARADATAFVRVKLTEAQVREVNEGGLPATVGDVNDPARNIREWYGQRRDEQMGISEPMRPAAQELEKTMAAAADGECPTKCQNDEEAL